MNRRTFLIHTSAAATALLSGCSAAHVTEGDASAHDGGTLYPDASAQLDAIVPGALVIAAPFRVLLNDSRCSHHGHDCRVEPGAWEHDVEISFLGGSHEVRFWVSELVRLQAGERIPFATMGPGPGHGHCGTAWRAEVGPFDDTLEDVCTPRGTAVCQG